jgi:hypothetical protein
MTLHDRRARDINRGHRGHVVDTEVDDPYEPGARIAAVRSVRDDPLADYFSRGHIDQARFLAGRQFQKHFGIAERGPRSGQLTERVDGNPPREALTDGQLVAWKWLAKCHRKLGAEGSALVHDVLVNAMTAKQIAAARGLTGQEWSRFYAKRFQECLNTLAEVYGFANADRYARAVTAPLTGG